MDSYSVSTSLTLDDKLIAGLKRVAAELRTANEDFDKLKSAARAGFSVRPAGVDKLRAELAGATGAAGKLRTALTGVKLNSAAASGAANLASSLGTAQARAATLARTLNTLRMPGAGGSIPPSGRGPWGPRGGAPGGPGGHGASPWGHGIFDRGFLNTAYEAGMIGHVVGQFFKPSVEFGTQRAMAETMGETAEQRRRMEAAAYAVAAQVPNKSAAEMMKIQRELLPIAAAGAPSSDAALDKMIEHLPEAARMDTLLANYLGEKGGFESRGHRMSQFYNALRAGELMGLTGDPLKGFVDEAPKAMVAGGGRLNMEQIRQFVATAGSAAIGMDPNFILKYLPELMIEQGGSKVGTMAATFMQSGASRMTRRALEENIRLGLIDPSKVEIGRGGRIKRFDEGAFAGEAERFRNPAKWALETLAPALQKQGIDPFSRGNPRLARELAMLFSDRNAQKFMEQLLLHRQAMQRFAERTEKARLDYERQRATNPSIALEGMGGSWSTLRTALGDSSMMAAIPIINGMSDAMSGLANSIAGHPELAHAATGATLGLGGVTAALVALGAAARGVIWAGGGLASIGRGAAAVAAAAGIGAGTAGGTAVLAGAAAATGAAIGVAKETTKRAARGDFTSYNAIDPPIDPFGLATAAGAAGAADRPRRPGRSRTALSTAANAGFAPPGTEFPIPPVTSGAGEGGPLPAGSAGGAAAGHLGGIAASISAAVGALEAAAGRPVNLTGQVTLNGDVHVSMGELGAAIGHMIARGLAHAASGGMTSGGARPDFSGGHGPPPPT
jgi:hypothetical protein